MDIFEKLLAPFTGLYFASGVFPGVGDAGAGDGAGDAGGGAGGDDGAGDSGTDEGGGEGAEEITEEVGDGSDGEGDGGAEDEGAEGEGDGEDEGSGKGKTPGKKPTVEEAIKTLAKTNKAAADVLRKTHFKVQQYEQLGSIPELTAQRDFIQLHGGEEEIGTSIDQAQRFATELDMVANGDKQIVMDIGRENPDGLMKLAPHVLSECERIDPKKFGLLMAKPMSTLLRTTGVVPMLQALSRLIRLGDQKNADAQAAELLQWVGNVDALADSQKEQPLSDREREIQQREQKVQDSVVQQYRGEVGKAAVTSTNTEIARHLTPLINDLVKQGVKLTLAQKQDLAGGIYTHIANSLKNNKAYKRQMDAFYARQVDPQDIAEYVAKQVRGLAEKATKEVAAMKGWAGRVNRKPAPGANGNGTKNLARLVSTPPKPELIDWSKDTDRARFMGDGKVGHATLKNGQVVRFRWDT